MEEVPQRVLVVIPHPNEAEFWCGGTISKWINEGATVRYVLCTDGGKGASDREVSSEALGMQRTRDQQKAAELLGVAEVVELQFPDGELEDTSDFRRHLVRQIRQVRPDVVICPEPYRKNLAWHRDHRITGQVALDAVFPCARDHLHFMELWKDEGLEPHKTGTVLFWGTERPDTYVDIGEFLDAKTRAVMAHTSQVADHSPEDIRGFIESEATEAASDQECTYGEAFRKVTFRTT